VTGLELKYYCANTSPMTQQVEPQFQVINNGSTAVPLPSLTIRYFFTKDGSTSGQNFVCDYAQLGNNNISAVFNTFTGTNADEYMEIHFAATLGNLDPGTSTGTIQARFYGNGYPTFTQTNDYSFDPTKTTFADSTTVTLYQNGTLVWGTEP
jgi:Cellulose binding domain